MALAPEYFTAEMVLAMPDDGMRHELVWGELLVSPSPEILHQRIVMRLAESLVVYCRRFGLGEVFGVTADISFSEDTLVQPDVFVADPAHARAEQWKSVKSLRFVAEVLSPSTEKHDRFKKRRVYQMNGVDTLWIVDPVRCLVEVWTPESRFPVVKTERVTWHPAGASEPLVIELADLFA